MAPALDFALALASGVPLAVLGAVLLLLPRRRAEQAFFGAFALLWGLQVVASNLGRVLLDPAVAQQSLLARAAIDLPMALFLVHFAVLATGRRDYRPTFVIAALAAGGAGVLAVAPPMVIAGIEGGGPGEPYRILYGPLDLPLVQATLFGAWDLSIALLYLAYRRAGPGSEGLRLRGMLLGLSTYLSYATVRNLLFFLQPADAVRVLGPLGVGGFVALFLAGAALLAGILLDAGLRRRAPGGFDPAFAAAFLVPAAFGAVEAPLRGLGVPLDTVGLWRLAAAAIIAYHIARYQVFDLELRLQRLTGPVLAGLALGFGALGALVLWLGGSGPFVGAVPLLSGALGASVAVNLGPRLGRAVFAGTEDPGYLRARRLEVYAASLEDALAAGGPRGGRDLERLRASLGITEDEHELLVFAIRNRLGTRLGTGRIDAGERFAGRYRVERLLGQGSYGRAFLAYDEQEHREVVLKTVATTALGGRASALLLREARLLAKLRHDNVVAVHDVVEGPQETVLVMEYCAGGNLEGLLERRGALGTREAARILEGILAGLAAAHGAGIVHRDVKPANVLVTLEGEVKLGDFGVARALGGTSALTMAGPVGTLLYMSPEQVRGAETDRRADLYAAGVLFHHLVTGRYYLPLAGRGDFQIRRMILEEPPKLDVADAGLRSFLATALAKHPAARFQTAEAMRAAVRALAGRPAVSAGKAAAGARGPTFR